MGKGHSRRAPRFLVLSDRVNGRAAPERWNTGGHMCLLGGNNDVYFLFLDILSLRGLQAIQVASYPKGNISFNFIQRRLRRIH